MGSCTKKVSSASSKSECVDHLVELLQKEKEGSSFSHFLFHFHHKTETYTPACVDVIFQILHCVIRNLAISSIASSLSRNSVNRILEMTTDKEQETRLLAQKICHTFISDGKEEKFLQVFSDEESSDVDLTTPQDHFILNVHLFTNNH